MHAVRIQNLAVHTEKIFLHMYRGGVSRNLSYAEGVCLGTFPMQRGFL